MSKSSEKTVEVCPVKLLADIGYF